VAAPLTAPTRSKRASFRLDTFLSFTSSTYWIPGHSHLLWSPKSTQMAAVPFGFSFGDFVAATEVIHKVAQALRRSSGAQSNFNQAVADLETFETVLRQLQALSPTTLSPDIIGKLRLCAFRCHPPLDHFLHRVRVYEPHLSQLSKPKIHLMDGITGTFWKIKWAIKVEEEVTKLKAAIGPQLVAIGVLLQVNDLEQNAAACQDITQLLRLTQNVTSGIDRIWLAVQDQALATGRIDTQTLEIRHETQNIVQELPRLATSRQLSNAVVSIECISAKMDSNATKDQTDELRSLLQKSYTVSEKNHTETMALSERQETHILQMARTMQAIHSLLAAVMDPHPIATPTLGRSVSMSPPSTTPPSMSSGRPHQSQAAVSRPYQMLRAICRLLVTIVTALLLMLPSIQPQLRTFMTLLKSPRLLSSNSIIFTDALNRTKLLPYEYFSNWKLIQPWLEGVFKGLPGESRVSNGHFAMFTQRNNVTGPEIPADVWEHSVFPGDQVVMSVRTAGVTQKGHCQRCGQMLSSPPAMPDWSEW